MRGVLFGGFKVGEEFDTVSNYSTERWVWVWWGTSNKQWEVGRTGGHVVTMGGEWEPVCLGLVMEYTSLCCSLFSGKEEQLTIHGMDMGSGVRGLK